MLDTSTSNYYNNQAGNYSTDYSSLGKPLGQGFNPSQPLGYTSTGYQGSQIGETTLNPVLLPPTESTPQVYTGNNLSQITKGLDDFLTFFQDAIDTKVLGSTLPLVGDTLGISEGARFIQPIKQEILNQLPTLGDNPVSQAIQQVLFNTLGNKGLNILQDMNGDGTVDSQDVQLVDTLDNVSFNLKLGKSPTSFTNSLAGDLGLPNLGLKLTGDANISLGYNFNLDFGVNKKLVSTLIHQYLKRLG